MALSLKGSAARPPKASAGRTARRIRFRPPVAATVVLGALASAAVLVVAEFLTLYAVRVVRGTTSVPPVAAGTENHYALVPIAILALLLAVAAVRLGDRWALAAVAALGLIALLIGLLHDLPDARRSGLVGSLHTGWVRGASSPSIGMYLETLGAVMLLLTAGLGLLFGEQVVEDAPAAEPTPVPFGVEPEGDGAGAAGAAAVQAVASPLEEPSASAEAAAVTDAPPGARRAAAPRKRSTSTAPKKPAGTTAKAKRSSTPSAKRPPSTAAKRSPPAARKQSTKRPSSTPNKGGSPSRSPGSGSKRSAS